MNKQSDRFESHTAAVIGLWSPLDENNSWLSKQVIKITEWLSNFSDSKMLLFAKKKRLSHF